MLYTPASTYGRIVCLPNVPIPGGNGVNYTTTDAYWHYLGRVKTPVVVKKLWLKLHQGSAGASQTAAEIGLFSTPLAPNGAGQTLTKLVAATLGDCTVAGPAMVQHTGGDLSYQLIPGTFLWVGRRIAAGTMPGESSAVADFGLGAALKLASATSLTAGTTFSGSVLAANGSCPGMFPTLD